MSTTPQAPPQPPRRRIAPDAVERLYIYWLVSTALLILVILVVALLTRGTLRRQERTNADLERRLRAAETALQSLKQSGVSLAAPPAPSGERSPTVPPPPGPVRPPVETATRPAERATAAATTTPKPVPAESDIKSQLDRLIPTSPTAPTDVADPQAAAALVAAALEHASRAQWTGPTWARLAVLARLVGRNTAAEAFAKRAAAGGDLLTGYTEVSVREALARGRAQEALPAAEHLVELTQGSTTARVLLAAAYLASDEPAGADEIAETVQDAAELSVRDRLLLARVLMSLERWGQLTEAMSIAGSVPSDVMAEHNFLQAVALAQAGRTAEALAILDYLNGRLAEAKPALGPTTTTAAGLSPPTAPQLGPQSAWQPPSPDRYEVEVWRGVTLLVARQPEAARQTLEAAARLDPGRPDAYYYLGRLEMQADRPSVATEYLKNALASSARMAPAWEALAAIELNAGHVDLALQDAAKALEINGRRASAHFLAALAHAKMGQREPAANELRATFQLDPGYLEEARQSDVITRLFSPEALEALASAPTTEEAPPERPSEPAVPGSQAP